jgi:hypothetical protein
MTETVMPAEIVEMWKPDFVVPMAVCLAHEDVPCTGGIFQAGGGWYSQVTWQRSDGLMLDIDESAEAVTPENLAAGWGKVTAVPAPQGVPGQFHGGVHKDEQLTQIIDKMQGKKEASKL